MVRRRAVRMLATVLATCVAATLLAACSGPGGNRVKVALILKEFTNPYWISMENAARKEADKQNLYLQVSAGKTDDDTYSQINQVDAAIASGVKGIIITPNGNAVNTALNQAKSYGIAVIVLDTAPVPPSTADVTYATDNSQAGMLVGKWMAAALKGRPADIALLDDLADQVLTVDVDRDHGFLKGMGIPVGNPNINGAEPKHGHYSGGKGGTYKISCQLATQGAQTGGQQAMETCLSKDPNINTVYTINEPSAEGATTALHNQGKKNVTRRHRRRRLRGADVRQERRDRRDGRPVPGQDGAPRRRRRRQVRQGGQASAEREGAGLRQHRNQALHRPRPARRRRSDDNAGLEDLLGW